MVGLVRGHPGRATSTTTTTATRCRQPPPTSRASSVPYGTVGTAHYTAPTSRAQGRSSRSTLAEHTVEVPGRRHHHVADRDGSGTGSPCRRWSPPTPDCRTARVAFYEGDTRLGNDDDRSGSTATAGSSPRSSDVLGGPHTYRAVFVPYVDGLRGVPATAAVTVDPTATTTDLRRSAASASVTLTAGSTGAIGRPRAASSSARALSSSRPCPSPTATAATHAAAVATGVHDYTATFVPANARRYAGSGRLAAQLRHGGQHDDHRPHGQQPGHHRDSGQRSQSRRRAGRHGRDHRGRQPSRGRPARATARTTVDLTDVAPGQHSYVATYSAAGRPFAGLAVRPVGRSASPRRSAAQATTTGPVRDGVGRTVTLAATVTASGGEAPIGAVQFVEDGIVLGSRRLAAGRRRSRRQGVAAGSHTYTATFVPADAAAYSRLDVAGAAGDGGPHGHHDLDHRLAQRHHRHPADHRRRRRRPVAARHRPGPRRCHLRRPGPGRRRAGDAGRRRCEPSARTPTARASCRPPRTSPGRSSGSVSLTVKPVTSRRRRR